jgi:hypothetical protein
LTQLREETCTERKETWSWRLTKPEVGCPNVWEKT